MMLLSSGLASLGLLEDSTAVVIGAMLLARASANRNSRSSFTARCSSFFIQVRTVALLSFRS